mgnify:CR=1 FL=1
MSEHNHPTTAWRRDVVIIAAALIVLGVLLTGAALLLGVLPALAQQAPTTYLPIIVRPAATPTATPVVPPVNDDEYVVLGWNDLGMHCYNRDFQDLAVLPPYNNLWAQVIKRGDPPQIITRGLDIT